MHTLGGPRGGGSDFNVVALDELVSEYLAAQAHHHGSDSETAGAADGAAPGASSSAAAAAASAAPGPQADTWAVRRLLEGGRVGEAVDLIQRACPEILEDQRLLFRLERQQFTELLRQGTLDGDARALECARQQLAPLALHAYPEAFTDFKTTMLMLVQRQPPRGSDGDGGGGRGSSGGAEDAAAAAGSGGAAAAAAAGSGSGSGGADGEWFWDTSDGRDHPSEAAAHAHCRGRPGVWVQGRRRRGGGGGGGGGAPTAARAARRGGGGGDGGGGLLEGARAARSVAARGELAEVVFHTMRQRLGWLDPSLSLVIRYLLLVASAHAESSAANAGLSGPEQELADRLLQRAEPGGAPLRDAAPLPNEASGMSFPEMDILALMHAARISRTAAWDSLKRAGGAAAAALRDELMRLRLEHAVMLPLAEEYAAYRGLCAAGEGGEGQGDAEEEEGDGSGAGGGEDCMDVDNAASTGGDAAAGAGGAAGGVGGGRGDAEGRRPRSAQPAAAAAAEGGAGAAAAAAGGAAAGGTQWARCDSRSPPYKVPRWLAQQSATGFNSADQGGGGAAAEPLPPTAAAVAAAAAGKRRRAAAAALRERHAPLLQLQAAARAGRWSEAESLLEAAAPGLLRSKRPELLFDLQRARFAQLVNAGDLASALALARTEMTPLADAHPPLLPALKAAMGSLLPGGGAGGGGGGGGRAAPDPAALGAALQELMAEALGLQGPRLASLLRALLSVHKSWFKMQRCADPFAAALGLTRLRSPDDRPPSAADGGGAAAPAPDATTAAAAAAAPGGAAAAAGTASGAPSGAAGAAAGGGASAGGLSLPPVGSYGRDEDSGEDDDGEEVDESSILRLMEILEIPRGLAIELLVQHHGSVEDAVMQVVAG